MPINFVIERSGRTFSATADGAAAFFVGYQTSYVDKSSHQSFEGLYNVPSAALPKLMYKAADASPQYGVWADLIAPTAACEGGNYLTLNTYDRARFTWGFGQFAAHVPDGDFIRFFRDLLGQPEAADYFPTLQLVAGRIAQLSAGGATPLESALSTAPLMDYLNPTTSAVEDAEVLAAARLIHWTTNHAPARELQAKHMVDAFRRLMAAADPAVGLDGRAADICCAVCDILHQGRAKYPAIRQALAAPSPLAELLKLGSISYPDRVKTLKARIAAAGAALTGKTWSRAHKDFV